MLNKSLPYLDPLPTVVARNRHRRWLPMSRIDSGKYDVNYRVQKVGCRIVVSVTSLLCGGGPR